jgi:K+-sensing histidine kinase KdpD
MESRPELRIVRRTHPTPESDTLPNSDEVPSPVVACVATHDPGNELLLSKAKSAATARGADFYAVFVNSSHLLFNKKVARLLIDDLILAGALEAKIVWLESRDGAGETLNFARKVHADRILVRRSEPTLMDSLLRRSFCRDLLTGADGMRVDVVGFEHKKSA